MWAVVALLGNAVMAAVGITDKFILTKTVSKPVIFVFYSTIFILGFFLLLPLGFIRMPAAGIDYLIFITSGASFFFGLWAMYSAIAKSEVSRVGPLIGAAAPFFILFLSRIFLDEKLTPQHLVGAAFLIVGSLFISFEKKDNLGIWRNGLGWAVMSGFFFAISHVAAKHSFDTYGFLDGFVLTKLPIGILGACLLFNSDVRAIFFKKPNSIPDKVSKKKQLFWVMAGVGLGILGTVLLQYAMALGSVTLVNSMAGVQYVFLMIFVALISKFFPNILKETFTKKQIVYKMMSVFVVGLGLVFLLY